MKRPPRALLLALLAGMVLGLWSRPAAAGETIQLATPAIAQKFTVPLPKGGTELRGTWDCLPASVAMLLQTETVRSRLPASAVTAYQEVRARFRTIQPDESVGTTLDSAVALIPVLTSSALTASWGYPEAKDQALFMTTWQEYLRTRLQTGIPVIVQIMDWSKLAGMAGKQREVHASIVTGISDTTVTYNDPWDGKSHPMKVAKFLTAWGTAQPGTDYRFVALDIGWNGAQAGTQPQPPVTAPPVTQAVVTRTATPATAAPVTATATATATPTTAGRLAYRTPAGEMVLLDMATGRQEPLRSPAPSRDYVVSADLSTFAWMTSVPGSAFTLVVERTAQGATRRSQVDLSRFVGDRSPGQRLTVTLSPDGSRALAGPLSIGATGRMFGVVMIATDDGRLITDNTPSGPGPLSNSVLQSCQIYEGMIDPTNKRIAGPTHESGSPGAGGVVVEAGVCSVSTNAADLALSSSLKRASAPGKGFVHGVGWSADGTAFVYAQSRTAEEVIVFVTTSGARTVLTQANAVTARPQLQIASPSLSNDGTQIAFARGVVETGQVTDSEVWVVAADGNNPRKIAAGSAPFWVRPVR